MKTILLISPYWKEPHRWMVSTVKLAELWQRLGYRVVVACMGTNESKDDKDDNDDKELISQTLTIYRKRDFFLPDPWNYGIAFGFTGMVRRIIKNEKPDIVVCNKILFWSSLCVVALRVTGQRVILLTDALVGMTWWGRTLPFRIASRIYAWTLGWLIMLCAERIVFFHPQPEGLLKTLGVAEKSQVIPTGIDAMAYGNPLPHSKRSGEFAGEGGSSPTGSASGGDVGENRVRANGTPDIVVTYVGRLESVKGVDDFLAAATPFLEKGAPIPGRGEIKIQVVGWFKENHPLVQQYQNRAIFTGLRTDIPDILKSTDIFVLPSYSEGLSNALMEAMSSSCACVASDVGGNAYLIQNGISGFLFPAGDREALTAHLRRLIDDPAKRKAMGDAARKRIEEWFSWEVVGKKYQTLFGD